MAVDAGPRNLLVIGKTGTGKSSTCNTLLQTDIFKTDPGGLSTTHSCQQVRKCVWGRTLSIIDTPGTIDVTDPKLAMTEMLKAMDFCPDGVDTFLLTFRCDVRASKEELKAAFQALNMFGPECYKRAIIVFTHSEIYQNDPNKFKSLVDRLCEAIPAFNDLVKKLEKRWVMLDNRQECDFQVREEQVKELLRLVDDVAKHNPRRYSVGDQEAAQRNKNELAKREEKFDEAMKQQMEMQKLMMQFMALQLFARENGLQMERENSAERERQMLEMLQQPVVISETTAFCSIQ